MSTDAAIHTAPDLYQRLMAATGGIDHADRHVLACALSLAWSEGERPLTQALGLTRETLGQLLDSAFPGAVALDELAPPEAGPGEDALEEPDYRRLLLGGRARHAPVEEWLACIVARRSMRPDHLWHALGLRDRSELSAMLHRNFPGLAGLNTRGMRWKKFFYREMCQAEGIFVCKSPVCDICPDVPHCFSAED